MQHQSGSSDEAKVTCPGPLPGGALRPSDLISRSRAHNALNEPGVSISNCDDNTALLLVLDLLLFCSVLFYLLG